MSTTARTPEQLTPNYFINRGPDETTVYLRDNVSLFGAIAQPTNPFDLKFVFDQPFSYDPKVGNLLMFIQTQQASPLSRTTQIDAHFYSSLSLSPVAATGNTGPFAPGSVAPYAVIAEFSWAPIPEPSPLSLIGMALACLAANSLRRR